MKIGVILPGFSASETDWCIPALLDQVRCLSARPDIELHVYPLRYPHHRKPYDVFGARVHPQGGVDSRGVGRLPLLSRAVTALRREHARSPFDLVHAYWADEPGIVAVMAATLLRVPAIVSLAGGELADIPDIGYGGQRNTANRLMTRIALRRADRVTAGSRFLLELAAKHVPRGRLVLMPLGVDLARFNPGTTSCAGDPGGCFGDPDKIHILNVASLVPVKDHLTLLQATAKARLQVPAVRLHLAGDGPMRRVLEERVRRLDLTNHVQFHGELAHHELPELYRASDFCVLSSRYEAQGMVVLEAGACGRTTFGTNPGILADVNGTGVVAPGDAHGLAEKMTLPALDSTFRRRLGQQALLRIREDFSVERTVDQLIDLYRDRISGSGRFDRRAT